MSEFAFIKWLTNQQQSKGLVRTAAGDDMAVLDFPRGELLLVGVDQVLDQVHFDATEHTARQIGAKVMNRNLSDCAAMACLPVAAVVAVALPRGCGMEYARDLYLGLKEAADKFDCAIIGGDTASWEGRLACSVTVLVRSAGINPVLRRGAKVGDGIFVSGALGGSILGRHMDFIPRINLARELAGRYRLSAMLDISDGLSRDLGHICEESGVGAMLLGEQIPIHEDARRLAARDGKEAWEHALHDGEDHELVFTSADRIELEGITRIGEVIAGNEIQVQMHGEVRKLAAAGWEHRL